MREGGKTEKESGGRENLHPRERAKDQGLVGGWIECYDVLRRVIVTKTMRLVTVIVRNVRLRAVTNRVTPILNRSPRRALTPCLPPPLVLSLLLSRRLHHARAARFSFRPV